MRRHAVLAASALALVSLLAACGGGSSATAGPGGQTTAPQQTQPGGEPGPAGPDATPGTSLTSCELVAPADIEAALELDAGSVAAGTFKETPTVLDEAENECRYQGDWGGLVVSVTPTDGINTYDAVEDTFGDDAENVQVGDGGLWFPENNRGYFLKGPVMVRLQPTHLTGGGDFKELTVALGTAAIAKI